MKLTKSPNTSLAFKLVRPNFLSDIKLNKIDAYALNAIHLLNKHLAAKATDGLNKTKLDTLFNSAITGAGVVSVDPVDAGEVKNSSKTLEQHISALGHTSLLYDVQDAIKQYPLSLNAETLLTEGPILDFLFLYGHSALAFKDAQTIARWIVNERDGGMRKIYEPIIELAVIELVKKEKIEVGSNKSLIDFIGADLKKANYSFAQGAFYESIKKAVKNFAYDKGSLDLIQSVANAMGITLSASDKDYLISYIEASNVAITPDNAEHFVAIALMEFKNRGISLKSPSSGKELPQDYSVNYYEERYDALAVNQENINASAQLFYVMTLADELGLINAADLLITKYLSSGQVDVRSKSTLQDLQRYAFSDEFLDINTANSHKRTEEEERRMFYRQVFNMGDGQLTESAIYNKDFDKVWNNLLTEVVQYISKLESSENPSSYVSRQYVAQAIEDLRYNLSTHCTGMAKIISPIINMELDYVIQRFFQDEEIIQQLALHNSRSFWKVPERILQDQYGHSINLSATLDKARYGHSLLTKVATFTDATLEDDAAFSEFVSTVEAFIIASSQVDEQPEEQQNNSAYPNNPMDNVSGDNWNF